MADGLDLGLPPTLSDNPTAEELLAHYKWLDAAVRRVDAELTKLNEVRGAFLMELRMVRDALASRFPEAAMEAMGGQMGPHRRRADRVAGRPEIEYEVFGAVRFLQKSGRSLTAQSVIQTLVATYRKPAAEAEAAVQKLLQMGDLVEGPDGTVGLG